MKVKRFHQYQQNETNNHLNEHKNDIRRWKFRSWFGTGTYMWRG